MKINVTNDFWRFKNSEFYVGRTRIVQTVIESMYYGSYIEFTCDVNKKINK